MSEDDTFKTLKRKCDFDTLSETLIGNHRGLGSFIVAQTTPEEICRSQGWELSDFMQILKENQDERNRIDNAWAQFRREVDHILKGKTNE